MKWRPWTQQLSVVTKKRRQVVHAECFKVKKEIRETDKCLEFKDTETICVYYFFCLYLLNSSLIFGTKKELDFCEE